MRMLPTCAAMACASLAKSFAKISTAGWLSWQIAASSAAASLLLRLIATKPATSQAPNISMYSLQLRARIATRSRFFRPLASSALASWNIRAACSAKVKVRPSNCNASWSPYSARPRLIKSPHVKDISSVSCLKLPRDPAGRHRAGREPHLDLLRRLAQRAEAALDVGALDGLRRDPVGIDGAGDRAILGVDRHRDADDARGHLAAVERIALFLDFAELPAQRRSRDHRLLGVRHTAHRGEIRVELFAGEPGEQHL